MLHRFGVHMCTRAYAGIVLDFGILYNTGWPDMHVVSNACIDNHAPGPDRASVADPGPAA